MRGPRSRAYDVLEADGGWLTAHGISIVTGQPPDSIARTMIRWVRKGYVEVRSVELARAANGGPVEGRREFRIRHTDPID